MTLGNSILPCHNVAQENEIIFFSYLPQKKVVEERY